MKLNFHKSFWEAPCTSEHELNLLLAQTQADGYQGTELFLPFYGFDAELTLAAHAKHDLNIITGIATEGANLEEHLKSLDTQIQRAITFNPILINSHTGRDIFSLEENLVLFEHALELEQKYKVTITHETHRFRPTFSTFDTEKILSALPELKLNLDISHWMVVHESDLKDQQPRLEKIFANVQHIHARVGFEEGPQVTNPEDPLWKTHLDNHVSLWQKVVDIAKQRKQTSFTITPEFGPFPYAHVQPKSHIPLADIWKANNFMKQHLINKLM